MVIPVRTPGDDFAVVEYALIGTEVGTAYSRNGHPYPAP